MGDDLGFPVVFFERVEGSCGRIFMIPCGGCAWYRGGFLSMGSRAGCCGGILRRDFRFRCGGCSWYPRGFFLRRCWRISWRDLVERF